MPIPFIATAFVVYTGCRALEEGAKRLYESHKRRQAAKACRDSEAYDYAEEEVETPAETVSA